MFEECDICSQSTGKVYTCKVCGARFCRYCGSFTDKICIDCVETREQMRSTPQSRLNQGVWER